MISKGNTNFSSPANISSPMQPNVLMSPTKEQQAFARLEKVYNKADYTTAEKLGRRLWKSLRDDPTYLKLMGLIKIKLEKYEDAAKYSKEAQKYDVTPEATINLAHALFGLKSFQDALDELNKVDIFEKQFLHGFKLKAKLLFKKEDFDILKEELEFYIDKYKDDLDFFMAHSACETELGNTEASIRSLHSAVKLITDTKHKSRVYQDIAHFYNQLGDKKESIKFYKIALENNPKNSSALRMLALLGGTKGEVAPIKSAEEAFKIVENKAERAELLYCMADSAKSNKEYDLAIDFYKLGAQSMLEARIESGLYHPLRKVKMGQLIIEIFANYDTNLNASSHVDEVKKLFVVGMPRSGTTLTESIIGAHSRAEPLGELPYLMGFTNRLSFKKSDLADHDGVVRFSEKILDSYAQKVDPKANGKDHIVDKMPANAHAIGFALAGTATSKAINLDRDPVAVAWSIFSRFFPASQMAFSYSFDFIINEYRMYMNMMNFWHQKFPGRIFDLNYETLTQDQERSTRAIIDFCELDFEDNCLNFQNNTRAVKTASSQQVKKGMYKGSSEEWKKYASFLNDYSDELYQIREDALKDRIAFYEQSGNTYYSNL